MTTALALAALVAAAAPLSPCTLDTPGMAREKARCGSVIVDDGVAVAFAVLEATGHEKADDPVVLLPGGPGQAATNLAGFATMELGPALAKRDVVLFDPRGTGRSGKLSCRDERTVAQKLAASDDDERARLAACAAALRSDARRSGAVDPASITTGRIAKDLEAVRVALGVEHLDLLGISYGTRLALAYDRAFPGRARALVLDSTVPFSMVVGATAARDAEAALDALDARSGRTGKRPLLDIVKDVRARLTAAPAKVVVPHPSTGAEVALSLDGRGFASTVRLLLYSDATAAVLPPLLDAADAGDLRPLAAQLWLADKEADSISEPMQLSVLCAEDAPLLPPAPEGGSPFAATADELTRVCAVWPHAAVERSFHDDAPQSQTPALVIAGGGDPVTPPWTADAVKKTLVRARVLIARGMGHNPGMQGCLPDAIARFLDDPTGEHPRGDDGGADPISACARRMRPFPAFVDATGPAP